MTSPFLLARDESLLERARATYYVTRLVAQTGEIGLTEGRLLFAPRGRLEQALGAGYPLSIDLRDIQRFQCEGTGPRRAVVRTAIQSHRFVGRDFSAIEARVLAAIEARGTAAPETVIASARTQLYVSRLLTQSGTLFLTDRQLSFVPIGRLDRVVGARPVAMLLTDLVRFSTEKGVDPRTTLEGKHRNLLFLGQLPGAFLEKLRGVMALAGPSSDADAGLADPAEAPEEPDAP